MLDNFKIIFKIYFAKRILREILHKTTQQELNFNFEWKFTYNSENLSNIDKFYSLKYLNVKDSLNIDIDNQDYLSGPDTFTSHTKLLDYYDTTSFRDNAYINYNALASVSLLNNKSELIDYSNPFSFFLKSNRLSSIVPNKKDSFLLHYVTLHNFLESMSKSKIVIVNRSSLNKHPDYLNMINNIYLLVKKIYKRSVRRFNLYNFIYVLVSSLVLNDIIVFKNFVQKKMSGVRFKKHKRLLSMFRYAFRLATSYFLYRGFIKGFFFVMSGKIGIGGSVKKRVWKYTTGSVNLSCKKSKVKYQLFQVWTRTGCLGCKVGLSV